METQVSISDWAITTFGTGGSHFRTAVRGAEEMAELLHSISIGSTRAEIAEEAADVAITLARLAKNFGVDMDVKMIVSPDKHGFPHAAAQANTMLSSIISMLSINDNDEYIYYPLRKLYAYLRQVLELLGDNLESAVDAKMAINRARKWTLDGHGQAYHQKKEE